ncbi:MAG: hypothetical protein M3083_00605 [Actinomycetota bacterium]|nr:hypothetical protein [Actinomycetota bacterium]
MVLTDPTACPIGPPAGDHVGDGYFEALSDMTAEDVRLAIGHFRHWSGHQFGPDRDEFLRYLDEQHEELHCLIEGCGWTEGVLVFVVGDFFDANVACGERWGLEPMQRLRDHDNWTVAYELHHHGERVCSATPDLNCDLLRLATSYGGIVAARAVAYDGTPGAELGSWRVSRQGITPVALTA